MNIFETLINQCIAYCEANPLFFWLLIGLSVAIVAVIVVIIVVGVVVATKKKKAKAQAAALAAEKASTEEPQAPEQPIPAQVEERKEEPVAEAVAETAPVEEVSPVAEAVEEVKEEPAPAPLEEAKEEALPKETEADKQEAAAAIEAIEKAQAEAKVQTKKETIAMQKPVQVTPPAKENEATENKQAGKWVVCRIFTNEVTVKNEENYFFELQNDDGEKLFSSEDYSSYNGAIKGIETHKKNIAAGNFRISLSKDGYYIFKLLTGKGTLLCSGDNYPTLEACENAIEQTKLFAQTAVLDENLQEELVKVPPEEEIELPAVDENSKGKWIIDSAKGANGEDVFFFKLKNPDNETLLRSEEYTTYVGAVNGIETHKKNIESENFRITFTKRGDYVYKLLNGNGQLLCLGEGYKSRKLCQNAVELVKLYAKNSSVLTNSSIAKKQ